jgi:hypothetical protein
MLLLEPDALRSGSGNREKTAGFFVRVLFGSPGGSFWILEVNSLETGKVE